MKLVVATPCYGGQVLVDYMLSWTNTISYFMKRRIGLKLATLGNESLIPRARNVLVARFLADPEATHLMFIDADISWNPEDIEKMILADKDIIGGVYPKKAYYWERLKTEAVCGKVNKLNDDNSPPSSYSSEIEPLLLDYVVRPLDREELKKDVAEVKYIGTGFMLIKRDVLEKMCEEFKNTHFRFDRNNGNKDEEKWLHALFDCKIQNEEYLSEDYLFCQRWRDMGGKIHAYTKAKLNHIGLNPHKGSFSERVLNIQ